MSTSVRLDKFPLMACSGPEPTVTFAVLGRFPAEPASIQVIESAKPGQANSKREQERSAIGDILFKIILLNESMLLILFHTLWNYSNRVRLLTRFRVAVHQ